MELQVQVEAIHQGKPAKVDVTINMTPKEFVIYVKDVLPLLKTAMKEQKRANKEFRKNFKQSIKKDM